MSTPYSAIEPYVQGNIEADLDVVNISTDPEGFEVVPLGLDHGPVEQKRDLFAKFNAAPTPRDNRRTIIRDWLDQVYDADHAIYLFRLFKLHIGAYRGSSYDLMAHAAVTEFGAVALPERVTAPIQHGYANPDLVAALAPARAQGGR